MAELERELIGERARIGLHALARQHKWPNPHPPLGYGKGEDQMLEVNGEEAKGFLPKSFEKVIFVQAGQFLCRKSIFMQSPSDQNHNVINQCSSPQVLFHHYIR